MAITRMTLAEIMARPSRMDPAKLDATTEEDIRRHMIEDGEDPDAPFDITRWYPGVAELRRSLGMTQEAFAAAIRVPLGTLRNWEQHRVEPDPAAKSLLWILYRNPQAALAALA